MPEIEKINIELHAVEIKLPALQTLKNMHFRKT